MDPFIILLVLIFFVLITYQIYKQHFSSIIIEGMDSNRNIEVDVNKNSGNIEVLKGQVKTLNQTTTGLNTTVSNLSTQVQSLQTQVQNMTNAQQTYLQPSVEQEGGEEDDDNESVTPVTQDSTTTA